MADTDPRGTTTRPVVWLTGLPSAGKSTLARALAGILRTAGQAVVVIDGDDIRATLNQDLGYSAADRDENVRRVGVLADLISSQGITVIVALVSPFRAARERLRTHIGSRFFEVWVNTPIHICAQRDDKGLYAGQRAGRIRNLTGIDDPYEPPIQPHIAVSAEHDATELAEMISARLTQLRSPPSINNDYNTPGSERDPA